ncbi:glycosyltransferase family 4 protein [Amycolatopsis sp. NPDC051371]|uniref:glycosyltransferase family 4 protein n=1 Tax=Amycolatopsis sp. NPDC051371 TaxID=3155800 RepID=UPI00341710E1
MIVRELPWLAGVDTGSASITAGRVAVGGWLVSPSGPDGSTVRLGGQIARVHWEPGTTAVPGVPVDWPTWVWRAEVDVDQPAGVEATVTAPDGTELSRAAVWPESSYRMPTQLGEIDFPAADAELAGDLVVVSGWLLLDGRLPSRIEVEVDGAAPQRARLMLPRPDVTRNLPGQVRQAGLSGYEARVPLPLAPGDRRKVSLRVRAWTRDGREWTSPVRYATLRRRAADRRDAEAAARASAFSEELLGRVKAAVDANHVLVVTHSLRVGGGQFWLSELLRHLVGTHEHKVTLVSPEDGPLRAELEDLGVTVHVTGHHRVQDATQYAAYVSELAMLATASGAGVVLVNTLGMFAGVEAAKRAGLPVAWVIHESFSLEDFAYLNWGMDGLDPLVRERWEHCLADADTLLFVADATREMFLPRSRPRRCVTVRYGIDLVPVQQAQYATKEEARRELGLPETATVLLNIGVSEPRKGQAPLLLAFEQVRVTHPDAHLVIVGTHESPYCDALQDYVEAAGLSGSVSLVPICRDPRQWLRAADLFVNSSDIESLPRSILEAMAFGLPVVAADVFGTREIVSDGESGWLFLPNDLNALTVGLLRALDTPPEARERIAERARAGVGAFLDSAHYGQEFSTILKSLARGTGTEERDA